MRVRDYKYSYLRDGGSQRCQEQHKHQTKQAAIRISSISEEARVVQLIQEKALERKRLD